MVRVVHLRVGDEGGEDWSAQLGDERRPVSARLIGGLPGLGQLVPLLSPPLVAVIGQDLARTRAETTAGRVLAGVFAPPELAHRLGEVRGEARRDGHLLAVALDATTGPVAALPWELLAWGGNDEPLELSGALVARLVDGASPDALIQGTRLRLLVWCPTPDDDACAELLSNLGAAAQRFEFSGPILLPASGEAPEAEAGVVDVLHIVCHGEIVDEMAVYRLGEQGLRAPTAVASLLRQGLARYPLVTLDVCGSGSPGIDQMAQAAGALLLAGAPACLAPARAATVAASSRFSTTLYAAIAGGRILPSAVLEARAAVRAMAHPHPAARAANFLFFIGSKDVLRAPAPVATGWEPAEGMQLTPRSSRLLARARALAREEGHWHVGLEHVAWALAAGDGGPISERLRQEFRNHDPSVWRRLAARGPGAGQNPRLSIRLLGMLAGQDRVVDVDDLLRAICLDANHGLHEIVGAPLNVLVARLLSKDGESLTATPPEARRGPPATRLQILWGPWDGVTLRPEAGNSLGRPSRSRSPDIVLEPPEIDWGDDSLSRSHLCYLGLGRVEVIKPTTHVRVADSKMRIVEVTSGVIELYCGDLLKLTAQTWLRAL